MSHIERNQNKKIYTHQHKLKQDLEKKLSSHRKEKSYPKGVVFSSYFWSFSHAAKHYILNFPQIQDKVALLQLAEFPMLWSKLFTTEFT